VGKSELRSKTVDLGGTTGGRCFTAGEADSIVREESKDEEIIINVSAEKRVHSGGGN